jgi:hypothetical protein
MVRHVASLHIQSRFLQLKASFAIRLPPGLQSHQISWVLWKEAYLWGLAQYDIIGAFIRRRNEKPSNGRLSEESSTVTPFSESGLHDLSPISPVVGASVTSPILAIATYRFLTDDAEW